MTEASERAAVNALVTRVRERFGPAGVEARRQAEDEARGMLDRAAGRMTDEQVTELGSLFNRHMVRGVLRRDRFTPAFAGATIQLLARRLDLVNQWTAQLWNKDESVALAALDELLRNREALPGAGRSYPTMLMYLRDSHRFAFWTNATERGLRAAAGYEGAYRAEGLAGYQRFSRAAIDFATRYEVEIELLDAVLAEASRHGRRPPAPGVVVSLSSPTLGEDAFQCLAALREQGADWMQANRDVYVRSLRRPFKQVMQALADGYVASLDPEINTEVKSGKVLASIRKRFPDEEGEYYGYYWGAFSRKGSRRTSSSS